MTRCTKCLVENEPNVKRNIDHEAMKRPYPNDTLKTQKVMEDTKMSEKTKLGKESDKDFVGAKRLMEELEKDLPAEIAPIERGTRSGKDVILEVLARAADDRTFLARLAENPSKVLQEYELTSEERTALATGDLRQIESWCGKLDKRLSTWVWCRLQRERW